MSNTKGKFYVRLAGAYPQPHFWNQAAQKYTANPHDCTLFDTLDSAMMELTYAERSNGETAEILEATR